MDQNGWVQFRWHYTYYGRQESLRRNGVGLIVNKRVQDAVLGWNVKNDRLISVCFQGKTFSITVIQVYAPTTNAKEAEVEQFYKDLQDLLDLKPKKKKRCPFCLRGLECKTGSQEMPGVTGNFDLEIHNEAGQRVTDFCQENAPVIPNSLFQQHRRQLYTWT